MSFLYVFFFIHSNFCSSFFLFFFFLKKKTLRNRPIIPSTTPAPVIHPTLSDGPTYKPLILQPYSLCLTCTHTSLRTHSHRVFYLFKISPPFPSNLLSNQPKISWQENPVPSYIRPLSTYSSRKSSYSCGLSRP